MLVGESRNSGLPRIGLGFRVVCSEFWDLGFRVQGFSMFANDLRSEDVWPQCLLSSFNLHPKTFTCSTSNLQS